MKCIISIELGTNAIRVVAFDLKGMVIGSLKGYCPTFHSEPDSSEQDPDQLFITMLYVLKNLLTDFVYPKKYVVISICFSACRHDRDRARCARLHRKRRGQQPDQGNPRQARGTFGRAAGPPCAPAHLQQR